ncbi:cbb3-type cytochrome c oxidase subunit 3 [Erythrobacter rubeus]|uniref:Cbb3-type cytochrome c oxidase subunit 3 n=1 Tax=Erythrobacter rubeus TaxID=2760803 RepID=A0ABR8KMX0_9SPHN|nr:CcoQ/FixQ family Cbb3-type cytochrome c oxidase assembly chaperone [Erythrobacter rubeus]MBD2841064.1 cbb3-type cytochrome c oxidase subunit 3 [Erythrobacter rubeus]
MTDYETLRQFADSYGLLAMAIIFVSLCLWPFRPGARDKNHYAAQSILEDNDDGE